MTHTITSPKPHKRGATFADVPVEGPEALFFGAHGVLCHKRDENSAYHCVTWELVSFSPDEPVTLLTVQPIAPEPDPDVCTYSELQVGARFRWVEPNRVSLGLCQLLDDGFADQWGQHWEPPPGHENPDVRRVSASVVEHEEPGTAAVLVTDYGDTPYVLVKAPERGVFAVSIECLAAIVRQGAALLAQQAPSSESSEPLVDGGDGEGYCPVCDTEQKGYPCLHPASEVAAVKMAEPAEDRSKPAPGLDVLHDVGSPGRPWWARDQRMRCVAKGFATEADAIAWTWTQHDAQQAGEGGE